MPNTVRGQVMKQGTATRTKVTYLNVAQRGAVMWWATRRTTALKTEVTSQAMAALMEEVCGAWVDNLRMRLEVGISY